VRIQVLGTGSSKNREFVANVESALQELGLAAAVEAVESIHQMVQLGVMSMPALAVDGEIKSTGRLLTTEEIKEVLRPTG
jgi:small redox-active disulfide protein 2